MTNNNNDDNNDDDSRKRKERPYLPAGDVQNGPHKRLHVHRAPNTTVMGPVQPTKTPVTGPPAQPEIGVGNPRMDSPAVYVPQQTTKEPFVTMGSTDIAPQYPQPQSQSQPQAQHPQQQQVLQPVGHRPGLDTKLAPGFPNMGQTDGQQPMTHQEPAQPQRAGRSVQHGQEGSSTGMLRNQAIEAYSLVSGGIPIEISATGWPGKDHSITAIPNSKETISIGSGSKGLATVQAQYAYHLNKYRGDVQCTMISVPVMSSRLPDPHQPRQPSTSTENLISTKKGDKGQTPGKVPAQVQAQVQAQAQPPDPRPLMSTGLPEHSRGSGISHSTENLISTKTGGRRQKPGKPQAQAQAQVQAAAPVPAPAQPPAQAHPQGQKFSPCANCSRPDHLVGDCVGPPNRIHGDLPACPVCDKFAGRVEGTTDPSGHRFDDCHHVKDMLHRHQWDIGHRLAYPDLAALTDDELLMFFRSLVAKRVRKVPIRTKLVCWIDVLREAVRRFHDTDIINSLGNMTPWTKTFSIQQYNLIDTQPKPWEFYDYAAGITLSLPAGPVEQAQGAWEDFVAKGVPGFPAQVFVNSDRN